MYLEKAFCCRSRHTPSLRATPLKRGLHPGCFAAIAIISQEGNWKFSTVFEPQTLCALWKSPLDRDASSILYIDEAGCVGPGSTLLIPRIGARRIILQTDWAFFSIIDDDNRKKWPGTEKNGLKEKKMVGNGKKRFEREKNGSEWKKTVWMGRRVHWALHFY